MPVWGSGPTVLLCHGFGHARNAARIRQPQRCACHGERRRRTGHSTWARPTGFAVDSLLEEAVTSEPVSGKRPEIPSQEGKIRRLGSRSNSPENGTPSGGGGSHYGILFPPITRTRARQPAPVQPLASRRVTYRSNRSNAPQNLFNFQPLRRRERIRLERGAIPRCG